MRDYKFADALVIGNDIYTVGSPTKCWCHDQKYSQIRISESLSEYEKNHDYTYVNELIKSNSINDIATIRPQRNNDHNLKNKHISLCDIVRNLTGLKIHRLDDAVINSPEVTTPISTLMELYTCNCDISAKMYIECCYCCSIYDNGFNLCRNINCKDATAIYGIDNIKTIINDHVMNISNLMFNDNVITGKISCTLPSKYFNHVSCQ